MRLTHVLMFTFVNSKMFLHVICTCGMAAMLTYTNTTSSPLIFNQKVDTQTPTCCAFRMHQRFPPCQTFAVYECFKAFFDMRVLKMHRHAAYQCLNGNVPVTHNHQDFPKSTAIQTGDVLQYKWKTYCDTNGRSTEVFPFPGSSVAPKALQYKLDAYYDTNWRLYCNTFLRSTQRTPPY